MFYMALRVIKQALDEKVQVYYECILKLANCLNQKANDSLPTTFFRLRLVPYLQVTTARMKRDTLFLHKKVTVTCEENMDDANEY